MTSDLTWVELTQELKWQQDARKDDGATETPLEARRVPSGGGTCTVVLDHADVSHHTLTPHAAIPHPARLLLPATPPSPPAMTLSPRAAPGPKKRTENQHTPAGTLSRPPGGVIPSGHPPGRRPCGTRGAHVSPESQRRHPVLFSISPKIIRWRLKVSRPSSLRSSPQNKKNRPLSADATLSLPFYFAPSL
ncbi:MAG: hypothetical protein OEU26_05185, partial [Candidatus Tectomicrobia bacterium]|nr:hypothetical protein [Candidatus Tectomicrobia bacterium]